MQRLPTILAILGATGSALTAQQPNAYVRPEIDGPVLDAKQAIGKMHVAEPFQLNLFAKEPHVINPVVMRFDGRGRLWVVEMRGYMTDLRGSKEMARIGRISILHDTDGDGEMDRSKVFLDHLVEPRALAFHRNGLLWADHQKLHHTVIEAGDKPGKTVVVDDDYSSGHSVEHKPNGLVRAIDNWYYNAKSSFRYRQVADQWVIERTEYRGQFGLSADDHGRLYHGQQNTMLRAEIFCPSFFRRNPRLDLRIGQLGTQTNVRQKNCFNVKVSHRSVFPVRTSRDIRDGYLDAKDCDIDERGFATRCTSACSHFYYRDHYFPAHFDAFVPDPALHLVKVISIERRAGFPVGKDVFDRQEILASPDTRFRPVDIQSAPDGTIYIADMYHGVLQHRFFMSAHLREFIKKHELEAPEDLGRIYRMTIKGKKPLPWRPFVDPGLEELVQALGSKSPWTRDTAQRLLVDQNLPGTRERLEKFCRETESVLGQIHALWTLEGIGGVTLAPVLAALKQGGSDLRMHAARVSWALPNSGDLMRALIAATPASFDESSYYLYQRLANFADREAQRFVTAAFLKWSDRDLLPETILSGSADHLDAWIAGLPDSEPKVRIRRTFEQRKRVARAATPKLQKQYLASFERGAKIYMRNCFSCHGKEGRGLLDMGPPVAKSDWVTGDPSVLTKILLKGMQGEIVVSGKPYQPKLPMLPFEAMMTDQQIADVLTFIRNSWGNRAPSVSEGAVRAVRKSVATVKRAFRQDDFR